MAGWGKDSPQQPHHRGASCPDPPAACDWNSYNQAAPNPHVLTGALVGGPTDGDSGYEDKRSNYQANEVAVDFNAGFTGALAGLLQLLPGQK